MSIPEPAIRDAAAGRLNRWSELRPLESRAGEMRVNLVRLTALLAFYGHHLLNVFVFRDDPTLAGRYHTSVTAVVLAWSLTVLATHLGLSLPRVPRWLGICTIGADALFITILLCLSRDPRSALAVLYFLVILSAGMRLSLPLVYLATLGSMAAYAGFLGYGYGWFENAGEHFSRAAHVIFLLALAAAGFLTGQMVRQARRLVGSAAGPRFCPACYEPFAGAAAKVEERATRDDSASAEARRDNSIVGVGLVLLGLLMAIALFWPTSIDNLDADSLVGLGFGLVLLAATATVVGIRGKDRSTRDMTGGAGKVGMMFMMPIVLLAALIAITISVLKTFY